VLVTALLLAPIVPYAPSAYAVTGVTNPSAKLLADNAAAYDYFGYAVAVSGNTAVVGAFGKDSSRGAAYVYVYNGTSWVRQQQLTASDGVAGDQFGSSVAIDGDRIIIGAHRKDAGRGKAYVYVRSGTAWLEQAKLIASDRAGGDNFGYAVAISDKTVLIGAPDDDDRGSAYVFNTGGTVWTQRAKLAASDVAIDDSFGVSVALNGDTALIGAQDKNAHTGAAYVFIGASTTWSQQKKLTAPDGAAGDFFGTAVACRNNTAVVGSYKADTVGGSNAGAAYVYTRSGTTWSTATKLVDEDGAANNLFGCSVAVSDNFALIGAMGHGGTGAAIPYLRTDSGWVQMIRLKAADGAAADEFGISVAVAGDAAVMGAWGNDARATNAGAAYAHHLSTELVARPDGYTVEQDTNLTVAAPGVLANDYDPEGKPLTAAKTSDPANGTATLNANGSFSYNPAPGFIGTDSFTYVANNGTKDSNTATVTITVTKRNNPPVAGNDTYAAQKNVTLSVAAPGVLSNDSDIDDEPLVGVKLSDPTHGALTFQSNGSFVYVPDTGYTGTDSFTYRAFDGKAYSAPATVSITVANTAPVAVGNTYSVRWGRTLTVAKPGVLGNDSDPNGDSITAKIKTQPAHGLLTFNADGSFVYEPSGTFTGTDSFTYVATDGALDSAPATVSIAVTNIAPVARPDAYSALIDETLVVPARGVLANDSDADGDALTAQALTEPTHGVLVFQSDGSFVYTPEAGYEGPDTFTYKAKDAVGDSDAVTVTITVAPPNATPVAADDSYDVAANVSMTRVAPGVLANDHDADADALSALLVAEPVHGSVTLNTDGSFTYSPDHGFAGLDSFTYQATDGVANSNVAAVNLYVTNTAPVANDDSYSTIRDKVLSKAAPGVLSNDTDANGDTLTTFLVTEPTHGVLVLNDDGSFAYTPAAGFMGTDTFTYRVHDGDLTSGTATVTITVTPPPTLTTVEIAGSNRIETAVLASKLAFPKGAETVVVTTGYNWPDALGGSSLAGAANGPILLTAPDSLSGPVATEISRLKAKKAYILGSTAAVSAAVETALVKQLGSGNVVRVGGSNRYETARMIAAEAVKVLKASGRTYDGTAFVATGLNFPDALGASPLAAAKGWPIFLVNPKGLDAATVSSMKALGVTKVLILGSGAAVPAAIESGLTRSLGCTTLRLAGDNRYQTAVAVASYGVSKAGLGWNKLAITTGINFPDALAGGVLQAKSGSVLLLNPPDKLDGSVANTLKAKKSVIYEVRFLGGPTAIYPSVRTSVVNLLK
jgi:VCBS repeat-containing protein